MMIWCILISEPENPKDINVYARNTSDTIWRIYQNTLVNFISETIYFWWIHWIGEDEETKVKILK